MEVWPGACPVDSGVCRVVYSSASFPRAKGECHKVGRGVVKLLVIVGISSLALVFRRCLAHPSLHLPRGEKVSGGYVGFLFS